MIKFKKRLDKHISSQFLVFIPRAISKNLGMKCVNLLSMLEQNNKDLNITSFDVVLPFSF